MAQPPGQLVLELRKIEDYCLNPDHPRGKHKARVFHEALGISRADAIWLRDALLAAVPNAQPVETDHDNYGRRWRLDVSIARQGKRAMVRTVWMERADEGVLRFVTCWVL